MEAEGEKVDSAPRTGVPGDSRSGFPSSPSLPFQLRKLASSFSRNCVQSQAPVTDRTLYVGITWDHPLERRAPRGYSREDAKDVSKTRPVSTGDAEAMRIPLGGDDMDTSETIAERRERAPAGGVMDSDIPA